MKRLFKISQLTILMLMLSTIVFTESGCSSPKKGYNYSSHNRRNKSAHRYEKKRLKRADNNPLNFRCRNSRRK
jgi:hypothetical protein